MKRILSAGLLAAVLALLAGAAPAGAQQQMKVGFVNTQLILAQLPGAQEAQQTLQREQQGYRTQLDSLEQRLQSQQEELERQGATLTEAARAQRLQELQQQFAAYQQRMQQLQATAQQRQQQLLEPLMRRVSEAIDVVRREGGFSVIVDSQANFIVAVDPALDITQRVAD
ncbi:MAG TPA: OmpH family outer membrane protein, partial [Longimicrobiaceae bacterium]|nr:OmpH family outer membrane protein [Longimicrobiaceae bacterium]